MIIKFLYILVTNLSLKDKWYPGIGSYEIDFVLYKELIGICFFIFTIFIINKFRSESFLKNAFIDILFILYYLPLNSSYSLQNYEFTYLILTSIYFNLIIILIGKSKFRSTYKKVDKINFFIIEMICVAFCMAYIAYKLSYNGLYFNFSFDADSIYSIRDEYTDYLDKIDSTFMSYLLVIIKNVTGIAVFYLLYKGLMKKNNFYFLISIFTILCIFSVNSSKSVMFFTIIVFIIYFIHKKNLLNYFSNVFALGMIFLLIISLGELLLFKESIIYTYVIRRELFYPSWLNHMYYDFFSNNSKLMLSDSAFLFQKFIPNVYSKPLLNIISDQYFAGVANSPNTGLFAEAYMHFGIVGIIIYPIIIKLLISFIDIALRGENSAIKLLIICKISISITNVPILRTDFIFSVIAFIFILFILKKISFTEKVYNFKEGLVYE